MISSWTWPRLNRFKPGRAPTFYDVRGFAISSMRKTPGVKSAMRAALFAAAGLLLLSGYAAAKDDSGRWVTFKTGHNNYGPIEYQIDRNSTRRAGPYLTFQARIW